MATSTELVADLKDWANRTDISDRLLLKFLETAQKRINSKLRIAPMESVISYTGITEGQTKLAIPSDLIEIITIRSLNEDGSTKTLFDTKVDARTYQKNTEGGASWNSGSNAYTRIAGDFVISQPLGQNDPVELYYYRILPKLNAVYPDSANNNGPEVLANQTSVTVNGITTAATEPACIVDNSFGNHTQGVWNGTSCTKASYPSSVTGEEVPQWFRDEQEELLIYGALVELWAYEKQTDEESRWTNKFNEKLLELTSEENMRAFKGGAIVQNIKTNLL